MRLPVPVLLGLIGAALVVLLGLGTWQLQRNEWKQDLVERSHARTDAAPLALRGSTDVDPEEVDYRRVTLEGHWLPEGALTLVNRVRAGTLGLEVVVPFRPADGGPDVLVNLGWIPTARDQAGVDAFTVTDALPPGETTISGLARDFSGVDGRSLDGASSQPRWTGLAPSAIQEASGAPLAPWVVIAGEEREGAPAQGEALPVQGWQRFHNTTPHIEYALTWFGIAAVLVAAAVARLVVVPRRSRQAARQAAAPTEVESTRG